MGWDGMGWRRESRAGVERLRRTVERLFKNRNYGTIDVNSLGLGAVEAVLGVVKEMYN